MMSFLYQKKIIYFWFGDILFFLHNALVIKDLGRV
jgi:hypothetical protein